MIEDQCAAMVRKETHEEERAKSKSYKKPKGTVLRPEPYTVDGADWSTLRLPYYEAEAARLEAISGS